MRALKAPPAGPPSSIVLIPISRDIAYSDATSIMHVSRQRA